MTATERSRASAVRPSPQPSAGRQRPGGPRFWVAVGATALLALVGAGALVLMALEGPEPRAKWGYPAAALAFLLSTAQSAPILAFVSRFGHGSWGVPLRRAAELFALAGLVTLPLFLVVVWHLPQEARPTIWFDWPGSPHIWDSLAVGLFTLLGLALVWVTSLPDLAQPGRSGRRLAPGWRGTTRQWRVLSMGVVALGALYLMLYVFVHLLVAADLALSLVPGWGSAVFPAYHAISGFEAGVAATVLAAALLRRFGGLQEVIDAPAFGACAKLLLALALFWFYFWYSEFLTYWYGRTPRERWLLGFLMYVTYLWPFLLSLALNFALPLALLIWNPLRRSIAWTTLVAGLIVAGNLVDRIRVYAAAWTNTGIPLQDPHFLPIPPFPDPNLPGLPGVLVAIGAPAAVLLIYLLALRVVPGVSQWESAADQRLRVEQQYVEQRVEVVARPS